MRYTRRVRVAPWLVLGLCAGTAASAGAPTPPPSASSPKTGVLCLRKLPGPRAFADEGKGSATPGRPPPARATPAKFPSLSVYVDEGAERFTDQTYGNCIGGLALGTRHIVHAFRDNKEIEVARFRFTEGRTLVLRYDPFYAHIHIEPSRRKLTAVEDGTCAACPDIPAAPESPKPAKHSSEERGFEGLKVK
jgi:hypothetical protein